MNLKVLNFSLALLLVLVSALALLLRPNPRNPGWEFLPDMVWSPASLAWEGNDLLPGGATFQNPQPGTRPWTGSPSSAPPPGGPRKFMTEAERGAYLFSQFCQTCHGPKGQGDGPSAQRGVPPPPSFQTPASRALTDAQILEVLTKGRGNMASYAAQVEATDRACLLIQIRRLQAPAGAGK